MRDQYDVIIIGAGPSGLSCAIELQKSDMTILLLEKNKEIGPKICAGGLTAKIKNVEIPLEISEILFSSVLVSVSDKTIPILNNNIPFVGTLDRGKLGQYLLNKLSNKVTILRDFEVSQIENDFIIAGNRKIKYKYLIGADGSNSIVRKFLGLKNNKFITAIQYSLPLNNQYMELCFDATLFGSGYGWIFPHKDYVSVGCGVQNFKCSEKLELKNSFNKWLIDKKIEVENAELQGSIISFDYRGFNFGNKFLVGDAGGFTSGLTGEGIYFGMVSGIEVARKIINPEYKCGEISEILKIKRFHENTLALISFLVKINKHLANSIFKLLLNLMKREYFSKKLIKHFG